VRQTGFIAAACRRNPPVPGVEAVRLPGEQALARRLQARAAGVRLYPGIMEARAPWAERLDVVAPARAH
jgi:LDH2 family malate/lactate/ureidoglycolate dehydrogenase